VAEFQEMDRAQLKAMCDILGAEELTITGYLVTADDPATFKELQGKIRVLRSMQSKLIDTYAALH